MKLELKKDVRWIGSSLADLRDLPVEIQTLFGKQLRIAQYGLTPDNAEPFGDGVMELKEDLSGDTYRAMYTVKLAAGIYVLHCFKKKSKKGIATPKPDIELINKRLIAARKDSAERISKHPSNQKAK